jgi:hypothetical protein
MLRRFASDCSCLFTESQIAPEISPAVAIPASRDQSLQARHLCSHMISIRGVNSETHARLRSADLHGDR